MATLNEMHKPKDPSNYVDIISPCYRPTLRYYFVREEMHKRHVDKTYARVEELLRTSLTSFEKALTSFQNSLVVWKEKDRSSDLMDGVEELVKIYENVVNNNIEKPSEPAELTKITTDDLEFILSMIYDRIIDKVDKLNEYEAWSSETYGETTFEFANEVIDKLKISDQDVFLDLGSGVGKVVMQAAAMCCCKKSYGIEIVDTRGEFAKGIEKEFRSVMNWMGKKHGDFTLIHGDFLEYVDIIKESNVIFCNNFAFEVQLDLELKNIFADLPEKVKVLVSKSLTDEKFRITEKNVTDSSAVLPVRGTFNGKMSWTGKDVTFYLHEIDRSMLNRFLESRSDPDKRQQFEAEQRQGRPKYYESSSEPESQNVATEKSDSEMVDEESDRVPKRITRSQPPQKTRKRGRPVLKENSNREGANTGTSEDSSTERTRSIPSQDSSSPRQPVKRRKRGRPAKSASRSAPSSSNGKQAAALDILFSQTVRSFSGTDRSAQPGCVPEYLCGSSEDAESLPEPLEQFMRKARVMMHSLLQTLKRSDYPSLVTEQMGVDKLKHEQLKKTCARLEKEVSALRAHSKRQMDALFHSRGMALPRSASDLSRISKDMLQTTNALRDRKASLKDDLNWIENSHQTAAVGMEAMRAASFTRPPSQTRPNSYLPYVYGANGVSYNDRDIYAGMQNGFSSVFPPAFGGREAPTEPPQRSFGSTPGSHMSSSSQEAKQRKSGPASSGRVMDLSRPVTKENVRSTPLASPRQSPYLSMENGSPASRDRTKSNAQKSDVRQGSSSGDPSYMSALGRMIEHSLSNTSKDQQPHNPARQEGNLRGPSPLSQPRQHLEHPQSKTTFNAQHTSTYPNPPHSTSAIPSTQPSTLTAAEQMSIAQLYPGAVVHPSAVQVYPGMIAGPYSGHYTNGAYSDPSGMQGGYANIGFAPQDTRGPREHGSSFISRPAIPAGFVSSYAPMTADPAQIAASMAGSFFAMPCDGRKSGSASQNRQAKAFEAISPPPV